MGCNCKDNMAHIEQGKGDFSELRELFISRMTVDSEEKDRRRRGYNQAIFDKDEGYAIFCETDLDMVLCCFDNAVKDWRKTFCDVKNCNKK